MIKKLKERTTKLLITSTLCTTSAISYILSGNVYADDLSEGAATAKGVTAPTDLTTSIKNVFNIMLFVVGVASVITLIIAGIRYVVSQGDPAAVKGAKDAILYAIIGIVVAVFAYAIVNYVITGVNK